MSFYVFYPHGLQLIEQLIHSLRALAIPALPDPTINLTGWSGLIILNDESITMPKWEQHFKKIEHLFAMDPSDPGTDKFVKDLDLETLRLLKEDKDAVRIIQHWERWNWEEAAEILKRQCGVRLNGTALREPLSDQNKMAVEDYIESSTALTQKVLKDQGEEAAEKFQHKLHERIKGDQKFFFSLTKLQA